jgi:hypothetical protein
LLPQEEEGSVPLFEHISDRQRGRMAALLLTPPTGSGLQVLTFSLCIVNEGEIRELHTQKCVHSLARYTVSIGEVFPDWVKVLKIVISPIDRVHALYITDIEERRIWGVPMHLWEQVYQDLRPEVD